MKKLNILLSIIILINCQRKNIPQIIYQDKIISKTDTLTFVSKKTDTIPCNDFTYSIIKNTDTVYIEVFKKELKIKTIKHTDTIYKEFSMIIPPPKKYINKIDNSIKNISKKGSAIGDGNKITTKKNNWIWIYIAGFLSCIIVNTLFKTLIKPRFL